MPEGVLPKAGGVLLRKEALGSSGIGSASAASIERVSAVARIPGVGDSSARLLLPLPSVPSGTSGGHSREGGKWQGGARVRLPTAPSHDPGGHRRDGGAQQPPKPKPKPKPRRQSKPRPGPKLGEVHVREGEGDGVASADSDRVPGCHSESGAVLVPPHEPDSEACQEESAEATQAAGEAACRAFALDHPEWYVVLSDDASCCQRACAAPRSLVCYVRRLGATFGYGYVLAVFAAYGLNQGLSAAVRWQSRALWRPLWRPL
jgi:hypothetical protein